MHQPYATSTGSLAASAGAQVVSLECTLTKGSVTPAAADAVLTIYDGTSTAGVVLLAITVKASTATVIETINIPVYANKGLFYTLTGAGATAVIHYIVV